MSDSDTPPRRRDAARTRQLLLDVASRRFATIGYSATTVREIADEAGVNVALINRYFVSKEGLYEAALQAGFAGLREAAGEDVTPRTVPETIAGMIAWQTTVEGPDRGLLLLLRPAGDEKTDRIRLRYLGLFGQKLGTAAERLGSRPDVLRAQIALAVSIGITLLRTSALEPLASATAEDLAGPVRDILSALMRPPAAPA
ncbi:helix-turn-helix domain-containing protein [Actinoplanes sp. NPDC051851]|uniref:TetR/AcrR family transcriptional regulator n=1 Tax=Actinoplanes sp. NPDC051851 TaxID=3154753 RepID=UPI003447CFDA